MTLPTAKPQETLGWRAWLTADVPASRAQARAAAWFNGWLRFRSNTLAMVGLVILLFIILCAVFAPLLATHDPFVQNLGNRLQPPGADGHIFGTDSLGRDIYSRLLFGARISIYIVLLVALVAPLLGLIVGTIAGYAGGWVDVTLMRFTDIFLAFPRLILALAFVAALGAGIENAVLAISITAWPPYARIARAETLTIRNSDFIHAVRLQGAGPVRIIMRHIWPLCISSLVIRVTLDMAGIILTAAGLGFLGLGAQPPSPEWGAMIAEGRKYILDYWWVATIPGLAIFSISLAFNLLGDGLRDVLDPKEAGR
ncbi:ABC transporter permease [Pseudooceanicola sp. 502str34]